MRNTSSRLGRRRVTVSTGALSSRTSRGTNALPSATSMRSVPSSREGVTPSICLISLAACSGWSEVIVTTSPPTIAFSSSGVPRAAMWPWSMIAMRLQYSASSM